MTLDNAGDTSLLLGSTDVPPVLEDNAAGGSPFLLTCDHYGRLTPRSLGDLGLPASELTRHIAWDIGIAGVAEALSKQLDAHLIAQRYSRLVIDCNRPPGAPSSIPRISEATTIPANEALSRDAAEVRRQAIFDPYHRRIAEVIEARLREGVPTVLVSLHSFTPVYAGIARPWHIGTLYQRDTSPRRGARVDEHGHRNSPGPDRRSGRPAAMGGSAGADLCRDRNDIARAAAGVAANRFTAPASVPARRRRRAEKNFRARPASIA